jgi:hypothetical protein
MILATLFLPLFLVAVALRRPSALEHHRGVFLLRAAGHDRSHVLERLLIGEEQLGQVVDVSPQIDHAVPIAREDRLLLRFAHRPAVEIGALVRLERFAVLGLHQRHAEHVQVIALARALRVEHRGARDIVVVVALAHGYAASGCFEGCARSKASSFMHASNTRIVLG